LQRAKHLDLSAVYNKALLLRSLKQVDFLAKPAYAVIELISTVEIIEYTDNFTKGWKI
jgi:hypothetical protein